MTEKEKNIYGFIAAIAVAIILWLLFRHRDKVKTILQDSGITLPTFTVPETPTYETPTFPDIEKPVFTDGCKMCMNGNYSIILPAGAPKVVEPAPLPASVTKYLVLANRGGSISNTTVTPSGPRRIGFI